MELKLLDFKTNMVDISNFISFDASDKLFGCSFNEALVHQVISSYLTNSRSGTKAQKNRSEVSGSNRKPWRQKGTGKARSGSVKSPIWRSGGVTFAATFKKYDHKINKKMYRGAIKSILSKLVCDNRLFLIKNFFIEQPKTQLLLRKLKKIILKNSVLIFTDILDKNLLLASRNLYKVKMNNSIYINPINLINFNITLISCEMIKKIEKQLI